MKDKAVSLIAFKDISTHLKGIEDYHNEKIYLVGQTLLNTKENRRLNKELGLNKVNYFNHKKENKMRTLGKIITDVNCKRGAPMGRRNVEPTSYAIVEKKGRKTIVSAENDEPKKIFDSAIPMSNCGAYDRGGAYWGVATQLRVSYTKDLSYINFYRTK
jgi:hypothetical protein